MSELVTVVPGRDVYHTDHDCSWRADAKSSKKKPVDEVSHRDECQYCSGDAPQLDGAVDQRQHNIAPNGPTLDRGRVSPKDDDAPPRFGAVWTRNGFRDMWVDDAEIRGGRDD